MLRTATFGAVFLIATAALPASAQKAEPTADQASEDAPEVAGDAAQPQAAASHKRGPGGKRSKRHPPMSGRVVPDDQLRQETLPRPSGRVHVASANSGDEADVNLFNGDGSYNLDAIEELSYVLRCRRTDVEKPI